MRLFRRTPVWIRISVLTLLVLAGVLAGTMALGATDIGTTNRPGGSHGGGQDMEMEMDVDGSTSDHGSDGSRAGMDHDSARDQGSSPRHGADHRSGGQ